MDALIGVARAPEHVFVARGLTGELERRGAPTRDDDRASPQRDFSSSQVEEGISRVEAVPFSEVLAMVAAGTIRDGETIAALALAGLWLGRFA